MTNEYVYRCTSCAFETLISELANRHEREVTSHKIRWPGVGTISSVVDHPPHYGGAENAHEVIRCIEAHDLGFHLGNAVKYILRAGKKDPTKRREDLEKAAWYLAREIERTK